MYSCGSDPRTHKSPTSPCEYLSVCTRIKMLTAGQTRRRLYNVCHFESPFTYEQESNRTGEQMFNSFEAAITGGNRLSLSLDAVKGHSVCAQLGMVFDQLPIAKSERFPRQFKYWLCPLTRRHFDDQVPSCPRLPKWSVAEDRLPQAVSCSSSKIEARARPKQTLKDSTV